MREIGRADAGAEDPSLDDVLRKLGDRTPGELDAAIVASLETEPVQQCPLCSGRRFARERELPDHAFPGGQLRLDRCERCGLVVLNPRLTHASVGALEDDNTFYDYDAPPDEQLIGYLEYFLKVLEGFLPRHGRMLDVGCARGYLLEAGRRRGWEVAGVEISAPAAARARADFGVPVYASLDDARRHEQPFDLVVVWHVLEHIDRPVEFLRDCTTLVARRGAIALQVPGYDFVDEYERRGERGKLLCSVHNVYFTEHTLRATLARAGLVPTWFDRAEEELMLTAVAMRRSRGGRGGALLRRLRRAG